MPLTSLKCSCVTAQELPTMQFRHIARLADNRALDRFQGEKLLQSSVRKALRPSKLRRSRRRLRELHNHSCRDDPGHLPPRGPQVVAAPVGLEFATAAVRRTCRSLRSVSSSRDCDTADGGRLPGKRLRAVPVEADTQPAGEPSATLSEVSLYNPRRRPEDNRQPQTLCWAAV